MVGVPSIMHYHLAMVNWDEYKNEISQQQRANVIIFKRLNTFII